MNRRRDFDKATQRATAEKWISYLRVSTDRQGKTGWGIEAQRKAVADFFERRPLGTRA